MDPKKDKQSAQAENKSLTTSQNNVEVISFFDQNENFKYVYKKTEKLTTAVYMVSNLFTDDEPMKWVLRKKTSEFLSFIVCYKDVFGSKRDDFVNDAKTKILDIVSHLEVASFTGLISTMNFSIIKQEFVNLIKTINTVTEIAEESSGNSISRSFFDAPSGDDLSHPIGGNFTPQIQHSSNETSVASFNGQKDRISQPDIHVFTRTNRQNIIIGLLKKRKELTIKDISQVIKNCSEKTIQRELVSLISSGVLKKTGERRWSKYSLI